MYGITLAGSIGHECVVRMDTGPLAIGIRLMMVDELIAFYI